MTVPAICPADLKFQWQSSVLSSLMRRMFTATRIPVLNLAIGNACEMQPTRNMMGTLKEVCIFFKYSPKRHAKLKRNIQERYPESLRSQLVNLCKTRWVARHDALEVFGDLYTAVIATFQDIVDEHSSWNSSRSVRQGPCRG